MQINHSFLKIRAVNQNSLTFLGHL